MTSQLFRTQCLFFSAFVLFLTVFSGCKKSSTAYSISGGPSVTPVPVSPVPAENSFSLVGFATLNGGTSGGDGGTEVSVSNYADLKANLESGGKKIVKISSRIYTGTKGGRININSDKTLLGIGSQAFLDGIGLSISGKRNILIRNVKISLVSITDRTDPAVYDIDGDEGRPQIIVNSGDAISISNASANIWIDHCELFAEDPAVQTNQDLYDGLIDIKNASEYITISWNYFHDHHKTHLVGSADTDQFDRKITFHHNYYYNIMSRLPLYRFGNAHIYNNYFYKIGSSAIDARMGACLKIENNVFETVKSPIVASGTILGKYELLGNAFAGVSGIAAPASSTCTFTPSYSYKAESTSTVKESVVSKAGVGKL
jgi:pectate lyase